MKRIRLTSATILLLLVIGLCGTASGDLEITGSGSKPKIGIANGAALRIVPAPWPMRRADAGRTGRSSFPGPGGGLRETASIDLYDDQLIYNKHTHNSALYGPQYSEVYVRRNSNLEEAFSYLLVGPGNDLYFVLRCSDESERTNLYSYSIAAGMKWYRHKGSKFVKLGRTGKIHGSVSGAYSSPPNPGVVSAVTYNKDGTEAWRINTKDAAQPKLLTAGGRIYMRYSVEAGRVIDGIDFQGNVLWTSDPFEKKIEVVAEDNDRSLYIYDEASVMHKINELGETEWSVDPPLNEYPKEKFYSSLEKGPICSPDGKVWVTVPYTPKAYRIPGLPYAVLNNDGTIYRKNKFPDASQPRAACLASNDRFYIAFEDMSVKCYVDWDELVWSVDLPGGGRFLDMVMDSDNILYVLHTGWGIQTMGEAVYISVLDPANAYTLGFLKVDIPESAAGLKSWLAIGDGKKLYFLNEAGYLKEYSSTPLFVNPSGKFKFTPKGEEEVPR